MKLSVGLKQLFLASLGIGALVEAAVVRQTWTVARGTINADGFNKSALLVNDQFPGPTLEANYGDTFEVTVINKITGPEEGTAIHWHGLLQRGTPYDDGAPAVDFCPIAPGASYTYVFKADQEGTSWWHSHYSAQLADGLLGPMIIHGAQEAQYDVDLGPVIVTNWYHLEYHQILENVLATPERPPFADNVILQPQKNYDCSKVANGAACKLPTPVNTFNLKSGKTYLMRLIHTGAQGIQHFSVDGHNLTIVANDFVPVKPYSVNQVILAAGQRTDVLFQATGKPTDSYWMRTNMSTACDPIRQPYGLAAIYYENANTQLLPTSAAQSYNAAICAQEPLGMAIPRTPQQPPTPSFTYTFDIDLRLNASGVALFYFNNVSFRGDYNIPTLPLAMLGDETRFAPEWNVQNTGQNSSIRIIIRNRSNLTHPMHMHGHNLWILSEGEGEWDGTIVNPSNPQRRDVQLIREGSPTNPTHLVIQYLSDNPGIWPLHCHISWHISNGFFMQMLEQPKALRSQRVPSKIIQGCKAWWKYTNHAVVDQIDSGLRR